MLPDAPPPPYAGIFRVQIGNSAALEVSHFAGCFEKQLGGNYEDCHITLSRLPQELLQWLDDATTGANMTRDLIVYQIHPQTFDAITAMEINGAFLHQFRLEDLDITDKSVVSVSLVVVPNTIVVDDTPGNMPIAKPPASLLNSMFTMSVDGQTLDGIRNISGLSVFWPKLVDPNVQIGNRQVFVPGPMSVGSFTITVAEINNTFSIVQDMIDDAVQGGAAHNVQIDLLSSLGAVQRTIQMGGVVAQQYLPFSTAINSITRIRSLNLGATSFTIQ